MIKIPSKIFRMVDLILYLSVALIVLKSNSVFFIGEDLGLSYPCSMVSA